MTETIGQQNTGTGAGVPVPAELVVRTRGLCKRFKKVTAVQDVALDINRGEVFGLVGPDGAGKTTMMRLVTAIMRQTAGTVEVLGHDTLAEPEPVKARVGYMAQQSTLYRDLSVLENLVFFADVFEVVGAEREQRIERLLRFANLTRFADRKAGHLSGGMQKKLALACTVIHEPELLLLDEPTTGVDPVSRREFWEILSELHLQGATIIVTTPYMDEAERCSRVGLLFEGQLIECSSPDLIRDKLPNEMLEVMAPSLSAVRPVAASMPGVLEVQTYGDRLHVIVDDAESRAAELRTALQTAGVPVSSIRTTRPRLEEAFISLIRQRESDSADEER